MYARLLQGREQSNTGISDLLYTREERICLLEKQGDTRMVQREGHYDYMLRRYREEQDKTAEKKWDGAATPPAANRGRKIRIWPPGTSASLT